MDSKYTVSARKFRPGSFSEIVGQEHIVRTLTNAISKNRIAHAYLFSGTRGVGKTTSARVLAKALNCKKGPTTEPCLECDNCKEITDGISMDVLEIDGASNRGIDNIRELRENARFSPTKSKYKIYIIDEVHQISKDAFNALLKTLEEPPPHVVFIFATTELAKVPDTILSRCQNFEFRSIATKDIATQLRMIAGHEGIEATDGAITLLARRARGSMRDAQSLFDQTAAYGGGSVSEDDVKLILGVADRTLLGNIISAVIEHDRVALLDLSEKASFTGSDPALFLDDLAEMTRDIMVAKISLERLPDYSEDEKQKLVKWGKSLSFDEIQRMFNVLLETSERMKLFGQPALCLEMGLLKLAEKRDVVKIDDLLDKVDQAQAVIEKSSPDVVAEHISRPPIKNRMVDENVAPAPLEISQAVTGGAVVEPGNIPEALKAASRPPVPGILENASIEVKGDAVVITVVDRFSLETLEVRDTKNSLEEIVKKVVGGPARIVVLLREPKDAPADVKKNGKNDGTVKKQIMDLPIIQKALDIFDGEVAHIKVFKEG